MTGTDIAKAAPADVAAIYGARIKLAETLAGASLLPEAYRKQPANILIAMEASESLGITLFQAINGIDIIKGKMALQPETMRALIVRDGHRFDIDVLTESGCRIVCARKERPEDSQTFEFTMADAQRAGLSTNDNYKKYPKAMMLARASGMAARALFADVIAGIGYTPQELADEDERPAVVNTARLAPKAKAKTVAAQVPADLLPAGVAIDSDGVLSEVEEADIIADSEDA